MKLKAFDSLNVVKIEQGHRVRFVLRGLSPVQRQMIQVLGLDELLTYLTGLAPKVQHSATALTG